MLRPRDMAMPVFRRLSLLVRFFGNPENMPDHPDMKDRAGLLRFSGCDLTWRQLRRHSSRQSATQSVSGLVGAVGLDFSNAPEWGPVLSWAPIIHIGKGTSMGLGRVDAA